MKTLIILLALALSAVAQTPLTNEEKLGIENASLKLELIKSNQQLLETQKSEIQKAAQAVFEGACKRAGIEIGACQFDQKAGAVVKAETPKVEVKK